MNSPALPFFHAHARPGPGLCAADDPALPAGLSDPVPKSGLKADLATAFLSLTVNICYII